MSCGIAFLRFKDFTRGNVIKPFLSCTTNGKYKTTSAHLCANSVSELKGVSKYYSTLEGQLIERRKNVVTLQQNGEVVRSYKRVNIKKILKGNKKGGGCKNEINGTTSERSERSENVEHSEGFHKWERQECGPYRTDSRAKERCSEQDSDTHRGQIKKEKNEEDFVSSNFEQTEGMELISTSSSSQKRGRRVIEEHLYHSLDKNKKAIHDENVKDTIDELFFMREKKKKLMKRLIFKNNHDYMELIEQHEEFKQKEDDAFYNAGEYVDENGNTHVESERYNKLVTDMAENGHGYLHEVEKENDDDDANMSRQFKFLKNNLNISIFQEIGKRNILDTCKRKRNMQNEIKKNSEGKNLFNNDIYFWLKRKVHRSVDWQLFPANLGRGDNVIDVTELRCGEQTHNLSSKQGNDDNTEDEEKNAKGRIQSDNTERERDDNTERERDDNTKRERGDNTKRERGDNTKRERGDNTKRERDDNTTLLKDNEEFSTHEGKSEKLSHAQKKAAPLHFLHKLNIDVSEQEKHEKDEVQRRQNEIEEKMKKEREQGKKKLIQMFLRESEGTNAGNATRVGSGEALGVGGVDGMDSVNSVDSVDSVDGMDSVNSVDSVDSADSADVAVDGREKQDERHRESGKHPIFSPPSVHKKKETIFIDKLVKQNEECDKKGNDYEGIVDNSKNVFKRLKENYEMFKKEKISPYLMEGCERYVNYYYGIEKEEKLREMKKYANLKFYDVIRDEKFTVDNYNMLIKSKIIFNKEEEAFEYFNLLKRYDFKMNVETYNSLMYTCIVHKNAKLSRLIYIQMIKDLYTPNKNTFCILIKAHIFDNDIRSAFHLYRKMIKENIEIDLPIYSTLIDGLIKHKLFKRAEKFFYYIVNYKNVVPDEILYTIMIKNCAYNREAEKCLSFYETMISNNLRITDITLIEIINCLSRREDYFHKIFHFYNIYLANDMKLNHRLMLYMIIACSNKGNIKRLKEILKTMNKHKIKMTNEMYCYVVRAFANNCRREDVTWSEKNNNIKYAWRLIYDLLRREKSNYTQHAGGEVGRESGEAGRESGEVGRESGEVGRESGEVGRQRGEVGRESGEVGRQRGEVESQRGEVESQRGEVGRQRGEVESQRGEVGRQRGEVGNLEEMCKGGDASSSGCVNTKLLNSIVLLYKNCKYYEYAINMLKYYAYFGCAPDCYTFGVLYKMLFFEQKDYGKVICLYNYMANNTTIKANAYTFNIVLSSAIKTKSSKNTLFVLRHMYAAKVYPTPKMVKKLFHVARHITDIQLLINSMIHQQKKCLYEENLKEHQLIQLNIDEYELNLFKEGKTFKTKSDLDKVREQFFRRKQAIEKEKRMSKGKKSSDWLPYGQYLQNRKKGGQAYANRVDRPKPLPFD
ncbi:pentatricopeptide repeat domain-containing protein, putative [Plasmodium ovale]|uniref:Pentatricopeptide repeat domain-containing protein, putative n=1 Tax=Plasmodium ovale TaxID=36330 RepID=A0A1C3KH96_PLAOA|nr:pentatricopeptide repeat domain-containing protein, putative [Plasmodium ovale]